MSGDYDQALDDVLSEQRTRELLQLALSRGFTQDFLVELFCQCIEDDQRHSRKLTNIHEFFEAVIAGKFDHMLKDESGQSLS